MSTLVIVESPTKKSTIKKYLGKDYTVVASNGHVRDLPGSKLSVDVDHDFEPKYAVVKGKAELVNRLMDAAQKSDHVLLATDPDREGEAISWHLATLLGLDMNAADRVTFNEITKSGIEAGMKQPRAIDMDLVNAQQARRILDRLVGYRLSPFVSQKIRRGLSAGRVQSVALRLIVDREKEIRAFQPEEYWSITAKLVPPSSKKQFKAAFYGKDGKKVKLTNKEQTDAILAQLEGAEYFVQNVVKSVRKKSPQPPFITSTMQQEASRKLGFQSKRTMKVAQELYEGMDVPGFGTLGVITYMRTDSLRISDEARASAKSYIAEHFGKEYVPAKQRYFKQKNKVQDGHEAIRPTNILITPEVFATSGASRDQVKLYKLIWERFVAALMADCLQDTVKVDITAADCLFKASGYTVKFDGYTRLYEESSDEEETGGALPALQQGDKLRLRSLDGAQHFTQPPARYTEAALIKTLEENGIGRPSTYASILSTILSREYVVRESRHIKPTELGEAITDLLEEKFPKIVNVKFTAQMEQSLDDIGQGEQDYVDMLHEFYDDFEDNLGKVKKEMEGVKIKLKEEETDVKCEKCGANMVIKIGRFGKFLACPNYPKCKNTKPFVVNTDGKCPQCGAQVVAKKSKRGYKFYGCSNYPDCSFMTWDEPTGEECPQCGSTLFKQKGGVLACLKEGCGYSKKIEKKAKK
ncbi:MAG: type I DNA topoisomerase [Ruminococcaceae bacterium]|nr:type I DNA topoisomerase [Oscillospiraceae bacterium]